MGHQIIRKHYAEVEVIHKCRATKQGIWSAKIDIDFLPNSKNFATFDTTLTRFALCSAKMEYVCYNVIRM